MKGICRSQPGARRGVSQPYQSRRKQQSKHLDVMFKHLVTTFSTTLAVLVFVAACSNSTDDEPTSPAVPQDVVTPDAAESEQVNYQGEFLRVIAPLDEARGYCLDIPGHMAGVQIESPLQVHTCKHGIWNHDGRFDVAVLRNGVIRMPDYELCLKAETLRLGLGSYWLNVQRQSSRPGPCRIQAKSRWKHFLRCASRSKRGRVEMRVDHNI